MKSVLLRNGKVVLSDRTGNEVSMLVEGESVAAISGDEDGQGSDKVKVLDADGLTIFPGFIDAHIHGAVGIDVNTADADGLFKIAEFLARNGVTAWMPTLVPDSDENYRRAIDVIDKLMEIQVDQPVAQALGVHYEGVFANEKMCGALRPEFFKTFPNNRASLSATEENHPVGETPTPLLFKEGSLIGLPRLKKGVHVTTLAPEIEGGIELIKELVRQEWICLIGHTKADIDTLDRALAAGAKHLTHFYNAMTGLHHRDVGVVGWALTNEAVTFDIIADGVHVHPKMLEFACRSKSVDKVSLISDSVAPTGLGDGEYEIWGEKVSVENGKTRNERGSIAGSVITMRDAVKRMLSLGFTEVEVSKMASLNPAKLLGIDKTHGSIEVGKRVDLVAIDANGNVKLVMIGGRIVLITIE